MIIDQLAEIIAQQFPGQVVSGDITALKVGSFEAWDSLAHFNLLLSVEEQLGIRFTIDKMSEIKSLREIQVALESHGIKD